MNYNPYAAPQAPLAGPATGAPYGQPQPWNTSEVVSLAWARFKEHGGVVFLSYFLASVISGAIGQIPTVVTLASGAVPGDVAVAALAMRAGGIVATQIVAAFFQVGLVRIWLAVARGRAPEFGTLFSGADRFLPLLALNFLMLIATLLSAVLLFVPAVILYCGLLAAQFYIVDAGMGPIQAMKASWSATRGQKGEILVLALAGSGLLVLGVLMCCIGTLATVPIYLLATAIVFTRLSGTGPAPAQVAAPGYGPAPAPYA